MDYFLTISDEASSNIKSTIAYLKREWSEKSVLKFKDELIDCFDSIIANPESFLLVDDQRGKNTVPPITESEEKKLKS